MNINLIVEDSDEVQHFFEGAIATVSPNEINVVHLLDGHGAISRFGTRTVIAIFPTVETRAEWTERTKK